MARLGALRRRVQHLSAGPRRRARPTSGATRRAGLGRDPAEVTRSAMTGVLVGEDEATFAGA
jgi:hypothetical protein